MDETPCPGCRELSKQVAKLTAQLAELTRKPDAVVNRKVWCGNRTAVGVQAQDVLMSAFETCRRQALSAVDNERLG